MKISLKEKLNKNSISLYIEYYKGFTKNKAGKIKHNREFEFLGIQLILNPKNQEERKYNKDLREKAELIFKKKQLDSMNDNLGIINTSKYNKNFLEFCFECFEKKEASGKPSAGRRAVLFHFSNYRDPDTTTFKDINHEYLEGFKDYLRDYRTSVGEPLKPNTLSYYFDVLKIVLKIAYKEGLIKDMIFKDVKGFDKEEVQRCYLTFDEVQRLSKAKCRKEVIKKAFLFACFTGLRFSDLQLLTWKQIVKDKENYKVEHRQEKTGGIVYIPLHKTAIEIIGTPGKSYEKIFKGLVYNPDVTRYIKGWKANAGIEKNMTFHTSRHTFATLSITSGTDLFSVSKLLGHKSISTTQIYAKVIDSKLVDAINNLPELDLS